MTHRIARSAAGMLTLPPLDAHCSPTATPATPHRTTLPAFKSSRKLNAWKLLCDNIGKDLSRISMPVVLNEPLSALQRFSEDLEYAWLLDKAAAESDAIRQLAYIAAFTVSGYAGSRDRIGKPFNPLLGETFELLWEPQFRLICEQVSHHPPVSALHADGRAGWTWWKQVVVKNRFKGKDMEVTPAGINHVRFDQQAGAARSAHYTWEKFVSSVQNIIIGKIWVDNVRGIGARALALRPTGRPSAGVPRLDGCRGTPAAAATGIARAARLTLRCAVWPAQSGRPPDGQLCPRHLQAIFLLESQQHWRGHGDYLRRKQPRPLCPPR